MFAPPVALSQAEPAPSSAGASRQRAKLPAQAPPLPAVIQAKLIVGPADDPLEHEADRAAAHVMRMPDPVHMSTAPGPRISRKCDACADEAIVRADFEPRARHDFSRVRVHADAQAPAIVDDVLRMPGRPLDAATRAYFEPRFGHDFAAVRVHADSRAAASAHAVGARAYTVGHDMAFGEGQFVPDTHAGRRLIAHELAHVVQQSGPATGRPPALRRSPGTDPNCSIAETILTDASKPEQARCITEDDPDFRQNYIDNNIDQAVGVAVPGTTWENLDQDRVPQIKLTYKDGRILVIDVKDIPLQASAGPVARGPRTVRALQLPARYEKRSDGLIYPIRSAGKSEYVAYFLATNIISLRYGLYAAIEELKLGFELIEAGAAFASDISALAGIASMGGDPEGLFEPIPRRTGQGDELEPPGAGSTGGGREPQKLLGSKARTITSDDDPRSVKLARPTKQKPKTVYEVKKASPDPDTQAEVRMGEHLADDGHEVHFGTGADLKVDGVSTDVKNLRSKSGISSAIDRSRNQSDQVAIDGTSIGLTEEDAVAGVREFETEAAKRPEKYRRVKLVYILLGDGKVYVYHRTGPPLKAERIGAGGTGQPR